MKQGRAARETGEGVKGRIRGVKGNKVSRWLKVCLYVAVTVDTAGMRIAGYEMILTVLFTRPTR